MSRYVSDIYAARYLGTRARQEDFVAGGSLASGGVFLILADGMGGHSDGNVASETAATAAAAALERGAAPVAAARAANHALAELKGKGSLAPNAGCTLIIATVHNGLCRWVSIGDSYLLCQKAGQQLERINPLHTYGARLDAMAGRGEISVEAAQSDPKRAALTSAVMGDDIEECSDGELMLDCGDRLILASDGYLTMGPELLGSFLSAHPAQGRGDAQMIATTILETVKRAGRPKQDNTSVVVYELAPAAPATPAAAPQSFPARRLIASACALILLLIGLIAGLLWNPTEDSGNVVLNSTPDLIEMGNIKVEQNELVAESSAQKDSSDKSTDTQPQQNDDSASTKANETDESVAQECPQRTEQHQEAAQAAVEGTKKAKQNTEALVGSDKSAEKTLTEDIENPAKTPEAQAQEENGKKATIVLTLWESIRKNQNKDIYASMSEGINDVVNTLPKDDVALQVACEKLGILAVRDELSKVDADKENILKEYFQKHQDMLHPGLEVLLSKYIDAEEDQKKITIKGDDASLAFLKWLGEQYKGDDKLHKLQELQECTQTRVSTLYKAINGQDFVLSSFLPIYIEGKLNMAACSYCYKERKFVPKVFAPEERVSDDEKRQYKNFGDSVKALFIGDNSSK